MSTESIRERLAGPPCSICGAPFGTAHGYSCPNHNRPKKVLPVMVELPRTDVELLLAVVEAAKVAAERYFNGTSLWAQINEDGTPNPPWLDDLMDDLQQRIDALEAG